MHNIENTAGHAITFQHVSKSFVDLLALDGVSFEVKAGSVHALFGENGAGKTTLMKALAGIIGIDRGHILLDDSEVSIASPRHARQLGIGMVHQHLSLIPAFTVMENIILEDPHAGTALKYANYASKLISFSQSADIPIDINQHVWKMSHSERQWAEIFRLLFLGMQTLILDEPTSSLTPLESDRLLILLKELAKKGKTILLITHKLREVESVADTVTVLRRGQHIATLNAQETTIGHIAKLATGLSSGALENNRRLHTPSDKITLSMRNCLFLGRGNRPVVENFSLNLRHGMIVGIAGISGNGQQEIAEAVAGLRSPDKGVVERSDTMNEASTCRYVPAERIDVGSIADMSVSENLAMRVYTKAPVTVWRTFIKKSAMRKHAEALANRFSIKHNDLSSPVRTLSGGNIQRLLLARELDDCSDTLVVHEPTAGLDIESAKYVRTCLREATARGVAVLLISSDIDEILEMSDSVIVLHKGRSMGIYPAADLNRDRIGKLMLGFETGICHA